MKKTNVFLVLFVGFLTFSLSNVATAGEGVPDGTYSLVRASVYYESGEVIDSLQSGLWVSGTLTVSDNQFSFSTFVYLDGFDYPFYAYSAGTILYYTENYHSMVLQDFNRGMRETVLVSMEDPLIVFGNHGGNAEVDQWELISPAAVREPLMVPKEGGIEIKAKFGCSLLEILKLHRKLTESLSDEESSDAPPA